VESGYQCTLNVGTSEPGIRDWVLFDHWIRDPGSGIGFFRIPDLGSRIPRPYPFPTSVADSGCLSRISDPDFYPSWITDIRSGMGPGWLRIRYRTGLDGCGPMGGGGRAEDMEGRSGLTFLLR
jgi:hypothetical protein